MASDVALGRHPGQGEAGRGHVGGTERWLSLIAGGALVSFGLRRPAPGNLLLMATGGYLIYRGATGRCPISARFGLPTATESVGQAAPTIAGPITIEESLTIDRPAAELYQFWRDVENLPRVMSHLKSVTSRNDHDSRWVAKAPLGQSVEWDAHITQDQPNQLIAWRAADHADVDNCGWVRFTPAPDGRSTEVRVWLEYTPPGGPLGATVAKLFGEEPSQQIEDDLLRFKRMVETGEIAMTAAQTSSRAETGSRGAEEDDQDIVVEASEASFPASDPPSWVSSKRDTPTTANDSSL